MLIAICVAGYLSLVVASGGAFASGNAVQTFFQFLPVPVLIGLAQMIALSVGQLNLAVGALGGFLACAMGVLMADLGVPAPAAIVIGLALGAAVGALTGALVVFTRINGFVVTLATMTILIGAQYRLVGTRTVSDYSPGLKEFGQASVLNIPLVFLLALGVAALVAVFFRAAAPGRRMLASGSNPLAATLSGVSNDRSIVLAHTLSGLVVAITAVVTVAVSPGVNRSIGGDWLLPSFAAPIIGGAVLTGGTAVVLGTVLAAFIVRLVDSARAEFSLQPSWVNFVVGAVVLGTVVLTRARETRRSGGSS
ncbi:MULTISPECIES: ABC transporter permease [Nonomuraea]|uniref:ABC transporter permease n=1 Tax=Nonomuraea mangrovi TaxID=2316207 RepID=A0ABW4TFD4_9ACTN